MKKSVKDIDIKGKKILFFAPSFFGYENRICEKMIEMGATVNMYPNVDIEKKGWPLQSILFGFVC